MKEINLHYYVPENESELETLIGKPVGIIFPSQVNAQSMTYSGIYYKEYEFLEYLSENFRDNPIIVGWRNPKRFTKFTDHGIKLSSFFLYPIQYFYETDQETFKEKLSILLSNNQEALIKWNSQF